MKKESRQKESLGRILKYMKKYWLFLGLSIALAVISVILTLYIPILTGDAIDYIVDKGKVDFTYITPILKKMVVVILITAVAQWIMNVCNNKMTYNIVRDIRKDAIRKIEILPLKYLDAHSYGEIVSRVIADVDQFADGLLMGFTQLFTGVVTIIGTLGFMLSVNVKITAVVVFLTPLSFVVAGFIAKKTFSMFKLQSETRGEQTALIDEMIGNQKIVQAFSHEDEALESFDEINERLEKYSLRALFFSSITNPSTRFINALVYAGVGVFGAVSAIHGGISVGQLSCFLSYANQYTKPFNEISGVVTELQNALACAARVFELIDEEAQVPDAEDAVVLEEVKGDVDLEHVYFSYEPGQKLIEDFNLHVNPGERVAIVGPTGCGKTTLVSLIPRLYDTDSGEVLVDGVNVRDYSLYHLREGVGMVLQKNVLFSGTIAENLRWGNADASDEEMLEASRAAEADKFVSSFPEGYETVLGQGGANVSGGQKQRLCIARALLKKPKIIILDDSTSAVDTATEARIREAFATTLAGTTKIIIAQRISSVRECDNIIVFGDGEIVGEGTHDELMSSCEDYRDIVRSQSGSAEKEARA